MSRLHVENHLVERIGWLRAAVLGANDGIVSTASLIVGVAAASAMTSSVLLSGIAGLVAGAMSMAAGEYVSVSSQSDTEKADLARETLELATQPELERIELQQIYVKRGLDEALALQVADQLMAKDALAAHALDELGISHMTAAKPVQAALTSALTFAIGAAMPLAMVLVSPTQYLVPAVSVASLLFLALLGAIGARAGGANVHQSNCPRHVLGGNRNGGHSRHWRSLWNSCIASQFRKFVAGTCTLFRIKQMSFAHSGFSKVFLALLHFSLLLIAFSAVSRAQSTFVPVPTQFIAALAEPGAKSGTGAESWGLWTIDPGPRGVHLTRFSQLLEGGSTAKAGWKFDANDWWLDENGLIMEHPQYGMPPGRYMVTGDREVTTILTVHPKDPNGKQRWELAKDATIYDVTHLRCRSARYKPIASNSACTPAAAPRDQFRVPPGAAMPAVNGCSKQDYTVLFIIGIEN